MSQGDQPEPFEFECHPECLKWSYWRNVIRDVVEEVAGLRPGQLVELLLAVSEAEIDVWWEDRPGTRTGQKAAVEMFVRGWEPPEVDRTFGFPHGATARVVARSRIHPRARDVVAAHLEGRSPSTISRDCKVGIPTVTDILTNIGEEPHRLRNLAKSADHNRAIQRRYEEGWSYKRIAADLGIDETKVKGRIQYLRRKGRIELPPRAQSNVRRRRPRAAE